MTDIERFLIKYMDLVEDNQFEELYEMVRIEFPTNGNISVIPQLNGYFLSAGIDVLQYLETIPAFFIQYEDHIRNISIPNNIKKINDAAFRGLKVEEINLPLKLKAIGNYCFCHNQELKRVTLPKNPSSLGGYMFADCNNLFFLHYPGTKEEFLRSNYCKRQRWLIRSSIKAIVCTNACFEISHK